MRTYFVLFMILLASGLICAGGILLGNQLDEQHQKGNPNVHVKHVKSK